MTDRFNVSADQAWREYARELADLLRERGDLTAPAWHAAITETPRHVLVPQVWEEGAPVDTTGPAGLAWVYSPISLVTKVDSRGLPISSSTKPDLMVRMLETLDLHDGHRVLEVGTGTGYNAALLSHRLGDDNVTSIDVDTDIVDNARVRLASLGAYPTLAVMDGEGGFPERAPYDRIIATCSVPALPWAWAEQLRDGGKVLASIMPTIHAGNLALLEKHGDRIEGRFTRRLGQFMTMRHNSEAPEDLAGTKPSEDERQRNTTAPAEPWKTSPVAWLWATLQLPGLSQGYTLDDHGTFNASYLTAPDGSWATVPFGDGQRVITEAGPTPIWDTIEQAHELWRTTREPTWERLGMTATPEYQTIWLDTPDSPQRWALKAT